MSTGKQIREKVAERLAGSSQEVFDSVVDSLAKVELEKRGKILQRASARHDSLSKQLEEVSKPDVVHKDAEGNVKHQAFTDGRLAAKKDVSEQLKKLDDAFAVAMPADPKKTAPDFGPLEKVVGC